MNEEERLGPSGRPFQIQPDYGVKDHYFMLWQPDSGVAYWVGDRVSREYLEGLKKQIDDILAIPLWDWWDEEKE